MMNQTEETGVFRVATDGKPGAAILIGHLLLLFFELAVVIHAFAGEGLATLRFYTTDSNLLCGVASALFLLQRGKPDTMVRLLRFIATSCLLVTFTVVLLVLGPQNGYAHEFLGGTRLFSHLLCPFLSLALFLTGEERAPQRWVGYALFTTLLYAIPMIILNAMGLVSGPYSFLKVREQSLASTLFWIVVILGGNALLARAAVLLQKRFFKR